MFIQASSEYIPQRVVDNEYFSRLVGRSTEWFEQRTGIQQRHRAATDENSNTMAISAVENLIAETPDALAGVDLIVGASYTPWDTIGTIAHVLQRRFAIHHARAIYVSTACSSFMDAMELAAAYMQSGRARKSLVVASEHNSLYSSDADEKSGHLWGDGAAAITIGTAPVGQAMQIVDLHSVGLADLGHGPEGIQMAPQAGGLIMRYGKDIYMHACREMAASTRTMLERHGLSLDQLRLLVPHQANQRIINSVVEHLGFPSERVASIIGTTGNTGCAGVGIAYHRAWQSVRPGEYALLVTFGGGYSAATALLRRQG